MSESSSAIPVVGWVGYVGSKWTGCKDSRSCLHNMWQVNKPHTADQLVIVVEALQLAKAALLLSQLVEDGASAPNTSFRFLVFRIWKIVKGGSVLPKCESFDNPNRRQLDLINPRNSS